MSEEELNEAMQYNLDYTEAMLNDELFGTNKVAEVKLLASEKTIKDLQQKVEQLENKIKYAQKIEQEYSALLTENTELENIRKEAIEFIDWHYKDNKEFFKNKGIGLNYPECDALLNILNKGSNKE